MATQYIENEQKLSEVTAILNDNNTDYNTRLQSVQTQIGEVATEDVKAPFGYTGLAVDVITNQNK